MNDLYIERGETKGQEALYAYLQRPADSDKSEDILAYERRLEAFKEFNQKYVRQAKSVTRRVLKKLTYSMLFELLEQANITLHECYKVMYGIEIEWPYAEMPALAQKFDLLSEEVQTRLVRATERLLSDFIIDIDNSNLSPSSKLREVTFHLYSLNDRKSAPLIYQKLAKREPNTPATCVPFKDFPEVAKHFRLPLHWLLCAGDGLTEFGNYPLTQRFMDCYMLLPPNTQPLLASMVSCAFLKREENNV